MLFVDQFIMHKVKLYKYNTTTTISRPSASIRTMLIVTGWMKAICGNQKNA